MCTINFDSLLVSVSPNKLTATEFEDIAEFDELFAAMERKTFDKNVDASFDKFKSL